MYSRYVEKDQWFEMGQTLDSATNNKLQSKNCFIHLGIQITELSKDPQFLKKNVDPEKVEAKKYRAVITDSQVQDLF